MATLLVTTSASAAAAISYASAITLGIGVVAVIAGIAAAMGAFSSAKSEAAQPTNTNHANGGIIGGNSLAGDNMKINANSGEMVLNRNQQAKLFNMINNGGGGGGPVQVTVYGQIDKKTLFTFMAEGERTNSNDLGRERQISNRNAQ